MAAWRRFIRRLYHVLRPATAERDLAREIEAHLALLEDGFRERGLNAEDAHRAARLALGGVDQTKERHRDARSFLWIDNARRDMRYAWRSLVRNPGFTVIAVLTLALGIGANTALFSAVNSLLLKTVPAKDPGTLVRLRYTGRNDMATDSSGYGFVGSSDLDEHATFSYPMYQEFRADNQTMSDVMACAPNGRYNVVVDGRADIATGFIASGNYYRLLRVAAALGRTLTPDDDRADAPPAAVISAKYWRSRFGDDPHVVGQVVQINNVPVTIVGITPTEFTGIQLAVADPPDVTIPLALDSQVNPVTVRPGTGGERGDPLPRLSQPTTWWLEVVGRMKPGVTPAQVQANLDAAFQHTARAGLDAYLAGLSDAERSTADNRNRTRVPRLLVEPGGRGVYNANSSDTQSAAILSAVVALLLLIVCANVANLLLSRAATRQKEISIRLSLGASRARLVQQLLTESVLLAAIGGAVGILAGRWGQQLLPGALARQGPLDWQVLSFAVTATALTGVLFGLAPAMTATRVNVSAALKDSSRSVAGSRNRLGKSLLIIQVAISLVLLVGAGLFLRTLHNLRRVDVGFNPRNLALFRVNPRLNGYDDARMAALYAQILDRLRTVPGVRSAALSHVALLSGSENTTSMFVEGRTYARDPRDLHDEIYRLVVSPNFFDVMQMPLVAGRAFTDHDAGAAPKVAVINEAAARSYFPGINPIGQRFGQSVETASQLEVVGVLHDVRYDSLRNPAPPTMYVPYTQSVVAAPTFEVRTARDPNGAIAGIRDAIRQIDPRLPLTNVTTQADQIDGRFQQEKLFAQAYALFGGLAVVIASVGLFGLMSYNVARRTNEIGIRMALGARRSNVIGLVMGESMTLVIAGVGIGLAIAVAAGGLVASLLFGLAATDVLTFLAAIAVMVIVSALAGYLPARRAASVDPLIALRAE
jgi:predicted permease